MNSASAMETSKEAGSAELSNKSHTPKYPGLGTAPIPIEPCVGPAIFEAERGLVFRRSWINVGRVERIAALSR